MSYFGKLVDVFIFITITIIFFKAALGLADFFLCLSQITPLLCCTDGMILIYCTAVVLEEEC